MKRLLLIITLTTLCGLNHSLAQEASEEIHKLDQSLNRKSTFEKSKQQQIGKLKSVSRQAADSQAAYSNFIALYDQYKSFKYDSAHYYASESMRMAEKIGKADYIVESKCAMIFCLISAGLYKEAVDMHHSIDLEHVSTDYRRIFYSIASRLYYDMADFNQSAPYHADYISRGHSYTDSLLACLQPQSSPWLYAVAMKQMKEENFDESFATFRKLLRRADLDDHTKAIVTSCLGWIAISQNEREKAKAFLAQAAIYDNVTATKENTALRLLGGMLYEEGDVERATRYVRLALDDANAYGARLRKIQVGGILPIIEQDRYNILKSERNAITAAFAIAILSIAVLVVGTYIIRKQNRKLRQARATIEQRNSELQQANRSLSEANAIKDEYIGRTFYQNAEYINKVEKLYKAIDRKITTKRYEDLRASLNESELIAERKSMFADFDDTFLRLFPNYVDRYNQLFDEKDRKMPDNEKALTNEMRIYALIRLGITDSERIAAFLDYSVHTINTYKTRIKNKSIVENDEFESRIMAI